MKKESLFKSRVMGASLLSIVVVVPTLAFASSWHFYGGIDGGTGIVTVQQQNPQITYYDGKITDSYPLNHRNTTTSLLGLNAGLEWNKDTMGPSITLGLGVYKMLGLNKNGQVSENGGDTNLTLYNYQFQMTSVRLMAETTLSYIFQNGITPLLDFGVGPTWNHLSNYSETVSPSNSKGYVTLPPFQSNTNLNLAYQIGMGVGYRFNFMRGNSKFTHEYIALKYRYANLGNNSFNSRGALYPYSLDLGQFSSQEILLNFTHIF